MKIYKIYFNRNGSGYSLKVLASSMESVLVAFKKYAKKKYFNNPEIESINLVDTIDIKA